MAVARIRRKLGVELAREEPRVFRNLDHLDEVIDGQPGESQPGFLELLPVVVIDLEAMPVTFFDAGSTIEFLGQGARGDLARICS